MSESEIFDLTVPGCPCGCARALCPRCYGDRTNLIPGLLGMIMGILMCHDCEMNFKPGEFNAMGRGRYDGQLAIDGKTLERRGANREKLRALGIIFDPELERQEAEECGDILV